MVISTERIFIIGGTGNIGSKAVQDLLSNKVALTLYARTPSKVEAMFPQSQNSINIVEGDLIDLTSFKQSIKGHTRLFLLLTNFNGFAQKKKEIAQIAYEAGVKQIVDISSFTVNLGWRTSYIGTTHFDAEKAIYDLPNRGKFVALRPGRFMTNALMADRPSADNKIFDSVDADSRYGYISTNDIGAVAAVVLTEDIEKHADSVYSLTGDMVSPNQRAQIVSDIVGRQISYQQITAAQKYHIIMGLGHYDHRMAMDLCGPLSSPDTSAVTPEISILLGREPETLKEFLNANKSAFF
ncbi:hypothetical protein EDC94DRAFT_360369 [Helicostylum pulchrum]|uniref:NmrA-like domain-containing protein n=1 Tax=Helicostylum pulchrum TaxID=562976 RepID=A0ABP9YGT7_9FUNG|nr:hypothetical protein EDC94DRAFT_360369 [Helicostylum pulchrum]